MMRAITTSFPLETFMLNRRRLFATAALAAAALAPLAQAQTAIVRSELDRWGPVVQASGFSSED